MAKNKKDNGKTRDSGRNYLRKEIKYNIVAIIFFTLAIITLLSFIGAKDSFGDKIFRGAELLFGNLFFLAPVILFIAGLSFLAKIGKDHGEAKFYYQPAVLLGTCLFFLSALALVNLVFYPDNFLVAAKNYSGGGYAGLILAYPLVFFLGATAAKVVLLALIIVSLLFIFNLSLELFFAKMVYTAKAFYNYYRFLSYRDRKTREVESENYADNLVKEPEESFASKAIKKIISIPSFKVKTIAGKTPDAVGSAASEKSEKIPTTGADAGGKEKSSGAGKIDIEIKENKRPPRPKEAWVKFPLALLDGGFSQANSGDINANVSIIEKTLANFGIEVEMGKVYIGPTVTQYTLRPAVGVKLSQITALANDLALSLAARSMRIEAPIPGKSLVGIEIPNITAATVRLKNILENFPKKDYFSDLSVAMGLDVSGRPYWLDISKAPHLLIAGSTGSGKTISINSLIMSLIYNNPPEILKLILIDPKRVELTLYNGIPHLLTPVIVEVEKAVSALKWAIGEMERRYLLLQESASRDIDSYNQKILSAKGMAAEPLVASDLWRVAFDKLSPRGIRGESSQVEPMPFIVIIIDELADLMATFPREIEATIVRLSQMSRAVGIHLVVSTQRPSVDVITGLIKANITSRVAFRVASLIDSRTILDHSGAEKLLGRGDMLFLATGASKPKRLQGCFVSETEAKKVVNWFKDNYGREAKVIEENELKSPAANLFGEKISGGNIDDEMYEEAKDVVMRARKASASLLQRRLRVGYARAARLLDLLEEEGVIGPADGAKPRQVLTGPAHPEFSGLANSEEDDDSKIVEGNI